MLHSFLSTNREVLVERCHARSATRLLPHPVEYQIRNNVPSLIDHLIETLLLEQTNGPAPSRSLLAVAASGSPCKITNTATLHARELLKNGITLENVVREYGDVCQVVTNLAVETASPITVEEFRTLNCCLDEAVAGAVTEYCAQQATHATELSLHALNSRLGPLTHELRNHLHAAMHAVKAIKAGAVGISGATGAVLDRSLLGMRNLIDSSLAEVRVTAGLAPRTEVIRLAEFLGNVEATAALDPRARGIKLTVAPVTLDVVIYADPEMLASAVGNLLQNAFKFTKRHTEVVLRTHCEGEFVHIEVMDHCGGLSPGPAEELLRPFVQKGTDRSGLGLGLEICRRGVEANNGTINVRNFPGVGCVFTITLPRHVESALSQQ